MTFAALKRIIACLAVPDDAEVFILSAHAGAVNELLSVECFNGEPTYLPIGGAVYPADRYDFTDVESVVLR